MTELRNAPRVILHSVAIGLRDPIPVAAWEDVEMASVFGLKYEAVIHSPLADDLIRVNRADRFDSVPF